MTQPSTIVSIDDILKEVSESAWSLGLQGASIEALRSDRNNRMTASEARQQITQLVSEALEYQVGTTIVPEARSLYGELVNDLTYISLDDVKRNLLERGIVCE